MSSILVKSRYILPRLNTSIGRRFKIASLIGLNQLVKEGSTDERKAMIMRLSVMVKRHGETPSEECFVLQNLGLGQPAMDTYTTTYGRLQTDGESYQDE